MKFQKIVTSAVALLATVSCLSLTNTQAKATEKTTTQAAATYTLKNKPNFSKYGYIMKIKSNDKVFVGRQNYNKAFKQLDIKGAKTVNAKHLRNVKFKIVKAAYFNVHGFGAPEYLAVSRNKRYAAWLTQSSLQYYAVKQRAMRPIMRAINRMINRSVNHSGSLKTRANKRDFNTAYRAARKLRGRQKSFVMASLRQLKKDGNIAKQGTNLLLFGL